MTTALDHAIALEVDLGDGKRRFGSGYPVSSRLVLTAHHVVKDAKSIQWFAPNLDDRKGSGDVLPGSWTALDLALVRIDMTLPSERRAQRPDPRRVGDGPVRWQTAGYPRAWQPDSGTRPGRGKWRRVTFSGAADSVTDEADDEVDAVQPLTFEQVLTQQVRDRLEDAGHAMLGGLSGAGVLLSVGKSRMLVGIVTQEASLTANQIGAVMLCTGDARVGDVLAAIEKGCAEDDAARAPAERERVRSELVALLEGDVASRVHLAWQLMFPEEQSDCRRQHEVLKAFDTQGRPATCPVLASLDAFGTERLVGRLLDLWAPDLDSVTRSILGAHGAVLPSSRRSLVQLLLCLHSLEPSAAGGSLEDLRKKLRDTDESSGAVTMSATTFLEITVLLARCFDCTPDVEIVSLDGRDHAVGKAALILTLGPELTPEESVQKFAQSIRDRVSVSKHPRRGGDGQLRVPSIGTSPRTLATKQRHGAERAEIKRAFERGGPVPHVVATPETKLFADEIAWIFGLPVIIKEDPGEAAFDSTERAHRIHTILKEMLRRESADEEPHA